MNELEELQSWFSTRCDGDWEHQDGIRIETLDNPGWRVTIHLADTELHDRPFETFESNYGHEADWLRCWRDADKFEAACGPRRLTEAIRVFLDWAAQAE